MIMCVAVSSGSSYMVRDATITLQTAVSMTFDAFSLVNVSSDLSLFELSGANGQVNQSQLIMVYRLEVSPLTSGSPRT